MYGNSPKLPLLVDSIDGHYGLTKTLHEVVQQNLKNLMLTSPGERVMLPDFGVGLRHFLFEPEKGLASEIKSRIFSQIRKYMPFVKIKNIEFYPARENRSNPNMLSVAIEYHVPSINLSSTLTLNNTA